VDNQRQILLVALGVILLLLWFRWEDAQRASAPVVDAPVPERRASGDAPAAPTAPTSTAKPGQAAAPRVTVPGKQEMKSGERIHVLTDLLDVQIDTFGGDVRFIGLRQHPKELNNPDVPFPLMKDTGEEILIAQSGIVGHGQNYPFHRTRFTARKRSYTLGDGQDSLAVDLNWRAKNGVRYTKRYTFKRNSYVVRVDFRVTTAVVSSGKDFFMASS